MTAPGERVLKDELRLSNKERAEIAARPIESLNAGCEEDPASVEETWAAEIERRCAALDAGTAGTTEWTENHFSVL